MTREDFEREAEGIKSMILDFYRIKDKGQRLNLKRNILYLVKQLLRV